MNWRAKQAAIVLALVDLAVAGCSSPAGPPTPPQRRQSMEQDGAVDQIYALFGQVQYDETSPDRPVIQVDFSSTLGKTVQDADLKCLEPLTEVRELDLTRTEVTGPGLGHLKRLTHLRKLKLLATKITDAGLA